MDTTAMIEGGKLKQVRYADWAWAENCNTRNRKWKDDTSAQSVYAKCARLEDAFFVCTQENGCQASPRMRDVSTSRLYNTIDKGQSCANKMYTRDKNQTNYWTLWLIGMWNLAPDPHIIMLKIMPA